MERAIKKITDELKENFKEKNAKELNRNLDKHSNLVSKSAAKMVPIPRIG